MKVIKESVNLTEGSVTYPHVLRNRGWEIVEDESQFTNELKKKKEYFEKYLTAATRAARCGWYDVKLVVYKDSYDNLIPYMAMCGDEEFNLSSCKLINVDGNSLGACLEELGRNIF